MIKFFREIRQKMLKNNKFSKYLLYAIGEILLVMIGIILAFQVNKWNENRLENELEIKLINDIKTGLEGDLIDIISNQEAHTRFLKNQIKSIDWIENNIEENDSITHYFSVAHKSTSFLNSRAPFESLKELGLNKVSDDTLRYQITYLYDILYPDFERMHTQYHKLLSETLDIGLIYFNDWSYKKNVNLMKPVNIDKLKSDRKYLMKLKHLRKMNELLLSQNSSLENIVNYIIQAIENKYNIIEK